MRFLKQSTSVDVVIGPVWSTTDGSLKGDLAYNASGINCDLYKVGTKADVTLANSAGDGYFRAGSGEAQYILTLSTGHTDTLGMLRLTLSATGYYMKPEDFMVVPANVWDSLFGADKLQVDVTQVEGADASDTLIGADADTLETLSDEIAVIGGYVDSILTDTSELQTDWHDGGRLDLILDAASAPSAADVADAVWDEAIADHDGVGSTGEQLAAAGAAGDPWDTALPGAYPAGDAGHILGALPAAIAALVGVPSFGVVSPVTKDGKSIELVQGADYATADSRQLSWTSNLWPDLDGATVVLRIARAAGTVEVSCSVSGTYPAAQTVTAEPDATDTALLDLGHCDFQVWATMAGSMHEVPLIEGTALVKPAVPAA